MEERELNYCFTYDTSNEKIKNYFMSYGITKLSEEKEIYIHDYYLNENTRIRLTPKGARYERKEGDKTTVRKESSHVIDPLLCETLQKEAKLIVEKHRVEWKCDTFSTPLLFSIDTVLKPFKVKFIELECSNEKTFNIVEDIFNKNIKRNTKNAWSYFKRKIGFCGAPACGKTIMARRLTNKLTLNYGASAEAVSEFARSYISHFGPPKWFVQPLITWQQQLREYEARYANIIICDSPTFLSTLYAQLYNDSLLNDTVIFILSEMYKNALQSVRTYDNIILLEKKELKKDNLRYQDEKYNTKIHNLIQNFLDIHNVPYSYIDYTKDLDELIKEIFSLNELVSLF